MKDYVNITATAGIKEKATRILVITLDITWLKLRKKKKDRANTNVGNWTTTIGVCTNDTAGVKSVVLVYRHILFRVLLPLEGTGVDSNVAPFGDHPGLEVLLPTKVNRVAFVDLLLEIIKGKRATIGAASRISIGTKVQEILWTIPGGGRKSIHITVLKRAEKDGRINKVFDPVAKLEIIQNGVRNLALQVIQNTRQGVLKELQGKAFQVHTVTVSNGLTGTWVWAIWIPQITDPVYLQILVSGGSRRRI